MDWTKIKLPEKKIPKRFQAGELSDLDHWKIIVIGQLIRKSVSSVIQTAVYAYLNQQWSKHEERLVAEAARDGVSPEEKFSELIETALSQNASKRGDD